MYSKKEKDYKMIKVYQIQLTKEQIAAVNAKETVPAYEAKMQTQFFGADKFESKNFNHYSIAFEIHTDDKDIAFEVTNLWNNQFIVDVIGDRTTSTSVGDIMENDDGKFFMVSNFGFQEVTL